MQLVTLHWPIVLLHGTRKEKKKKLVLSETSKYQNLFHRFFFLFVFSMLTTSCVLLLSSLLQYKHNMTLLWTHTHTHIHSETCCIEKTLTKHDILFALTLSLTFLSFKTV